MDETIGNGQVISYENSILINRYYNNEHFFFVERHYL